MKSLNQTRKIKNLLLIVVVAIFSSLILSCSKDDIEVKQPKVDAMVSNWFDAGGFRYNNRKPIYFYDVNDARITQNILDQGQVLVYVCIVDVKTGEQTYHRVSYNNGSNKIDFKLQSEKVTITMNYNPMTSDICHYFCYILIPEGYEMEHVDLNNFEEVAANFNINKEVTKYLQFL